MRWIARLEAEVYLPEDAVPESILLDWYKNNPEGFSVLKSSDGERIGHIDILPLRPAALRKFLNGLIVEREISGDDLYSPKERSLIKDLYVESVAIPPAERRSIYPAIVCLLSNLESLISRMCDVTRVESIYAVAATTSGERFLRHLGFLPVKAASERKDRHSFFAAGLRELDAAIARIYRR